MDEAIEGTACPACGKTAAVAAKFCGECGVSLDATAARPQAAQAKWYHNLVVVLLMLFFVLGPFGLPLVWNNPKFSRGLKVGLTIATTLYTLWLVQVTISLTKSIMQGVSQFNSTLAL